MTFAECAMRDRSYGVFYLLPSTFHFLLFLPSPVTPAACADRPAGSRAAVPAIGALAVSG